MIKLGTMLIALAMAACTNNDGLDEQLGSNEKGIQTISADIIQYQPSSRVVIGESNAGKRTISWKKNDKILVFGAPGESAIFTYNGTTNSPSGIFEKDAKETNTISKVTSALFANNLNSTDIKNLTDGFVNMSNKFFGSTVENAPMYGHLEADGSLKFYQTMGMLELDITNLYTLKVEGKNTDFRCVRVTSDKPLGSKGKNDYFFHLVNTDNPLNVKTEVVLGKETDANMYKCVYNFINSNINTSKSTKVFLPILVGEYPEFTVELFYDSGAANPAKQGTVYGKKVLKPKAPATSFQIDKKLYTVKLELEPMNQPTAKP